MSGDQQLALWIFVIPVGAVLIIGIYITLTFKTTTAEFRL